MDQNEKYLKTAVTAAKKGVKIFLKNFSKPKTVEKKGGDYRNLVTEVDREIENIIKSEILHKFPTHSFLGEESGQTETIGSDLIWIVDPIDGTTNFIQGLPLCCISIALWDKKGPLLGVIYDPLRKNLFTSKRGEGAFLNRKKIQVSAVKKLHGAVGCISWTDPTDGIKLFSALVKPARKIRVLASSVLTAAYIGSGSFDFFVADKINIWDFAAGAAIVSEAGGKITDFKGKPFTISSKNVILSNGRIQNEIIKQLKSR